MLWFQKSRMAAIRDGDRNTRYFHLSTIIRRKYNRIESLQDSTGVWITEPNAIHQLVLDYFSSLFTEVMPQRGRVHMLSGRFPLLQEETFTEICKPFTAKDIHSALQSMDLTRCLDWMDIMHYFSKGIGLWWVTRCVP